MFFCIAGHVLASFRIAGHFLAPLLIAGHVFCIAFNRGTKIQKQAAATAASRVLLAAPVSAWPGAPWSPLPPVALNPPPLIPWLPWLPWLPLTLHRLHCCCRGLTPTATSVPCHSFFSRDRDRHLPSACSPLALLPTRHAAVPSPLPLLPPALAPQPPAPPTLCCCCCHRRLCRCHCLYPFSLTASPTPAPMLTPLPAPSHAPPLP